MKWSIVELGKRCKCGLVTADALTIEPEARQWELRSMSHTVKSLLLEILTLILNVNHVKERK